jgi:hypothetical protein
MNEYRPWTLLIMKRNRMMKRRMGEEDEFDCDDE